MTRQSFYTAAFCMVAVGAWALNTWRPMLNRDVSSRGFDDDVAAREAMRAVAARALKDGVGLKCLRLGDGQTEQIPAEKVKSVFDKWDTSPHRSCVEDRTPKKGAMLEIHAGFKTASRPDTINVTFNSPVLV